MGILIYILFATKVIVNNNSIISIIRNFLPDMCWTLSFYFASINISKRLIKKSILINAIYVFSIGVLFEFMQYFNWVNGTFDIIDILVYFISILVACIIEKHLRRSENEKDL